MGWIVFATVFGVYAWTASPAIGWLDSPEFVAASVGLGVAHSPGHPVPLVIGKLFALLPVGDLAFRVNLGSAAAGAAAAAALTVAGERALQISAPALSARTRAGFSAALGLLFALSWAAWIQAGRAEVYSLQAALSCAALAELIAYERTPGAGRLCAAALWLGLALANHHFMAVLLFVPAALFVYARRRRPTARSAGLCASFGILGLVASLLYLPLRSLAGPIVNWGAPHTAERFLWTYSARAFQQATTRPLVSTPAEEIAQVTYALGEAVPVPLLAFALLAIYAGLRSASCRRLTLLLLGIFVTAIAGRVLVGFDPGIPDHHGYLLPAVAALCLLAVLGVAKVTETVATSRSVAHGGVSGIAMVALLLVLPIHGIHNARSASLRNGYASDDFGRWQLDTVPPGAILVTSYFQTSFRISALQSVEETRPDIATVDRSFLTYPGAADHARELVPELAALIDAPLRAGVPTPIATVSALARERPVFFELHENLDHELFPHLVPLGGFALFSEAPPAAAMRATAERADLHKQLKLRLILAKSDSRQRPPGDAGGVDLALLWHEIVRLEFYCALHRMEAAQTSMNAALALAPGDRTLADLAKRCRLSVSTPSVETGE